MDKTGLRSVFAEESRDYKRLFGRSPSKDIQELKKRLFRRFGSSDPDKNLSLNNNLKLKK